MHAAIIWTGRALLAVAFAAIVGVAGIVFLVVM